MKKSIALFIISVLLFGCEKQWDDPIPEWAELGVPTLRADINEDGFVVLQWGNYRITQGCMDCVPWVEASSYDIFVKKPGVQNFERLVNLELGSQEFLIDTGDTGRPYEFYVRANRAGRSKDSNTVMIVPAKRTKEILIFRPQRIRSLLLHPQISPNEDKVAFTADSTFIEGGQPIGTRSLFIWDIEKQKRTLIRRNARHAKWSSDGRLLIYTTNDRLEFINSWHIPSHIEIYDTESRQIQLFNGGFNQQFYPNFNKEGRIVYFLSDALGRRNIGLWKRYEPTSPEPVFAPFPYQDDLIQITNLPLLSGMDVSNFNELVAVSNLHLVFNRPVYNIYGFDMRQGGRKSDLMVSPWNDFSPSFSPYDPNLLAFLSDRSGSGQVWLLNIATGELKQVSYLEFGSFISSDSNAISWVDQGKSLAFPVTRPSDFSELIKIQIPS